MIRVVFALLLFAALALRADERIDVATNHLAGMQAGSNYSFSISFGPQGALIMDGYAAGTSRAFRVEVNGRELLRVAGSAMWMPSTGTNGATLVTFDQPLIVGVGYARGTASLSFGVVPPQSADPFLAANYAGLNEKLSSLPLVTPRADGWTFCETNEVGSCIEITDAKSPERVEIALVKTAEDKSSVFIHSLRVIPHDPKQTVELPAAKRTVALHDFIESLTYTANIVHAIQQAAMEGRTPEEVFADFGHYLDVAVNGLGFKPPPFPPPSMLQRTKPGFPPPPSK